MHIAIWHSLCTCVVFVHVQGRVFNKSSRDTVRKTEVKRDPRFSETWGVVSLFTHFRWTGLLAKCVSRNSKTLRSFRKTTKISNLYNPLTCIPLPQFVSFFLYFDVTRVANGCSFHFFVVSQTINLLFRQKPSHGAKNIGKMIWKDHWVLVLRG